MKLWQKIDFVKDGKRIKKYKLCGITLLRKEKSATKKKWNAFGVKIARKRKSKAKNKKITFLNKLSIIVSAKNNKNTSTDYQIIAKSEYFDKKWYLKTYPDVAKAGIDPIEHYLRFGWKEGRNPSKRFDGNYYLEVNQDIRDAHINPLLHYEKNGRFEKRKISKIYEDAITLNISDMLKYKGKKVVLFSHELSITGAPVALAKLAVILKSHKYKPFIISAQYGPLEKILKKEQIRFEVIQNLSQLNISDFNKYFSSFDFAICNTYLMAEIAVKLQNILPTLLYIHEGPEGIIDLPSGQERSINGIKITSLLSKIENLACVSPYAQSFYTSYCMNKIEVLKNYTDEINLPVKYNKNKVCFCYVGTITKERKNINILLQAYRQLSEKYSNIELHMIGNYHTKEGKEYVKEYPDVVWHGVLTGKRKNKVINNCDVVVICSQTESCSLVALEAASLSKAVIITQTIGAKYMFKDNVSAMLCLPNDVSSLADKMSELVCNKSLIPVLGKNAYASYIKNATKDSIEKDLFKIIRNMTVAFQTKKEINNLTIIVPVYNAAEKVDKCIASILKYTNLSSKIKLLIIDDCSPDPKIRTVLSKYANRKYVQIIYNKKNLGYTLNINKAIKLANRDDVILQNSDTIVTKNWVKKIQEIAYLSESIGTVTPVSNSAGAFSIPASGSNELPAQISLSKMAQIVSVCGKHQFFDVPTGNGFCFFIKRKVLDTIGLFDEKNFPRGYGEENDFSMRAKLHGFLNIVTLDTYIFHHEHASFKETCNPLMQNSAKIINSLYPSYQRDIRVFSDNTVFNEIKDKVKKEIEKIV